METPLTQCGLERIDAVSPDYVRMKLHNHRVHISQIGSRQEFDFGTFDVHDDDIGIMPRDYLCNCVAFDFYFFCLQIS